MGSFSQTGTLLTFFCPCQRGFLSVKEIARETNVEWNGGSHPSKGDTPISLPVRDLKSPMSLKLLALSYGTSSPTRSLPNNLS